MKEKQGIVIMTAKNGVVITEVVRYPDVTNDSMVFVDHEDVINHLRIWLEQSGEMINNQIAVS